MRNILFIYLVIGAGVLLSCSLEGGYKERVGRVYSASQGSILNKGVVPLSTTSPYVASNIFIAEEVKSSRYFRGFIKTNGVPLAIELREGDGGLELDLYYPRKRVYYIGEKRRVGDNFFEWYIRGPFGIGREKYRVLRPLEGIRGEPLLLVRGEVVKFSSEVPAGEGGDGSGKKEPAKEGGEGREMVSVERVIIEPRIPVVKARLAPKHRAGRKKKLAKDEGERLGNSPAFKAESKEAFLERILDPKHFRPLNTDQMALAIAKGYAERNLKGDIVHTVRSSKESLEAISTWYTGDPKNAALLREANRIKEGEVLRAGMKVIIPKALIKRIKAMPEIP